jgi:N-acetylated-alpha-linked acidic dipeptidase
MSSVPHLAGTDENKKLAEYVKGEWDKLDIDMVKMLDYSIYLDYPDDVKYNRQEKTTFFFININFILFHFIFSYSIEIRASNDFLEKNHEIKETIYDKDLDYSKISKPFLAYSKNGSVTSKKVFYMNYCSDDDFIAARKFGISVNNSIVLCKYGFSFRGNKVCL